MIKCEQHVANIHFRNTKIGFGVNSSKGAEIQLALTLVLVDLIMTFNCGWKDKIPTYKLPEYHQIPVNYAVEMCSI